jgi:hypothetical protein
MLCSILGVAETSNLSTASSKRFLVHPTSYPMDTPKIITRFLVLIKSGKSPTHAHLAPTLKKE